MAFLPLTVTDTLSSLNTDLTSCIYISIVTVNLLCHACCRTRLGERMVSMSSTLVETVSINYEDFNESFLTCGTCLCECTQYFMPVTNWSETKPLSHLSFSLDVDVLLTVHLSMILVINQLNAQNLVL